MWICHISALTFPLFQCMSWKCQDTQLESLITLNHHCTSVPSHPQPESLASMDDHDFPQAASNPPVISLSSSVPASTLQTEMSPPGSQSQRKIGGDPTCVTERHEKRFKGPDDLAAAERGTSFFLPWLQVTCTASSAFQRVL